MGIWDKVKSVAISAKCMTGWHAGDYTPISAKPKCNLEKTCPDCNNYVTTVKHKFDGWEYLSHGRCDAQKECIHCGHKENEVRHEYKAQGKDSKCCVIEVCNRCQDKKSGREDHSWIKIPFTNSDVKANGKRKCKDCGKMES